MGGNLFVVSAPSGAGKTSLVKRLLDDDERVRMSVSYTTRPRRDTEVEGRDYFFVSKPEFERLRDAGEMLEHAEVFTNYYGTGQAQVRELREAGNHVVLEIDWQGAQQVRAAAATCQSVFVLPPSQDELERRLRNRQTDSDDVIAHRLSESVADMSHWHEFDFVIINDNFNTAAAALGAVIDGRGDPFRTSRPEVQEAALKIVGVQ
ncbi:MAG: guanylate kinase [Gammaproteobacteria bacterium]